MTDIELNPQGEVVLDVDRSIYDESVIDKVLYWWGGDYVITRRNIPGTTIQTIVFSAPNPITQETFDKMRQKLSDDFDDVLPAAVPVSCFPQSGVADQCPWGLPAVAPRQRTTHRRSEGASGRGIVQESDSFILYLRKTIAPAD